MCVRNFLDRCVRRTTFNSCVLSVCSCEAETDVLCSFPQNNDMRVTRSEERARALSRGSPRPFVSS